jgi:hypothetical protein
MGDTQKYYPRKRRLKDAAALIAGSIAVLGIFFALAVLVLSLESNAAPQGQYSESSPHSEPAAPALSHPIPYDAVVCQGGKCRYYIKERK